MGDIISKFRNRINNTPPSRNEYAQPVNPAGIKALPYRSGKMINEHITGG